MLSFKKISSVIISLSIVGLLAACGDSPGSAKDQATASAAPGASAAAATPAAADVDLSKVTLSVGQTGWGSLENGFKAAGLDKTPYKIEFSVFQGGNLQLEAMGGKHLDLGTTSEIPPLFASLATNGGNFKVIAVEQSNTLTQELVIPKGSSIKSVADLKGKKVAYVSSTTAHYFLIKMLKQAGLTWADIQPQALSTSDGLSALLGGKVDALASYGNAIITAHANGATTLEDAKDILSGSFLIEASLDAISDPGKHAAIVDFLDRFNKFYEWTRNNQQQWAEITATNTKQPVEQALNTIKNGEKQRPTKLSTDFDKAIASQQDVADTLSEVGLLKEKLTVSSFWSREFEAEVKKIVGQ
jgi:sulfonate transport system substrate-binding protein